MVRLWRQRLAMKLRRVPGTESGANAVTAVLVIFIERLFGLRTPAVASAMAPKFWSAVKPMARLAIATERYLNVAAECGRQCNQARYITPHGDPPPGCPGP